MRKIFLTSGLVLCMVGSNAFAATDIDANGNVGGSAATCVYNVLDTYEGSSSFDAKWTPNNYTITFAKNTLDKNGIELYGTPAGSMSNQTYAYDSTANLTSNAYSITGYNFDGWSTTTNPANVNGGNATLTDGQSVTYTYPGNATLTARWDPAQSGAITLNSSVYPGNDTNQTPLYTTSTGVTAPTTTTVYSVYNNGLYSDSNGTTAVVAANLIPSKDGYTFGGFYNSAGTTQYINGSGVVQDAATRVVTTGGGTDTWYADWAPDLYEITYKPGTAGTHEVDGNRVTKAVYYDATTYSDDSTLATLANNVYSVEGYSFAGWSSDHNVTTGANTTTLYNANTAISPYKVVGDTEMIAQWNPICYGAITLDSKKYSSSDDNTGVSPTSAASPSSIYVLYDNGIYTDNACTSTTGLTNGKITIPTLTGYNFTGFYDRKVSAVNHWIRNRVIDQTGAIIATIYDAIVTETTLYAGWSPKTYQVTYTCGDAPSVTGLTIALDPNGVPPAATTGTYDANTTVATNGGTCALDGDRGGYHFGGWSCNPAFGGGSGTSVIPSQLGQNGWALSSGSVGNWHADSDVTCRFRWTGNDYTISYNHGTAGSRTTGFSGTMSDTTAKFGSSTTLTANAFSIPGYEFAGWSGDYNNSTGANTASAYTNEQQFTYILPNNLNLTAQWTPKRYNVRYSTCANGSGSDHRDFEAIEYDGSYTILGLDAVNLLDDSLFGIINITPPRGYHVSQWTDGTNNYAPGDIISQYTTDSVLLLTAVCAPNVHTITYGCGSAPTGASTTVSGNGPSNGSATYDSTYDLSATYGTCVLPGYHATGWDCSGGATLSNANGTQSALATDADIACNVHWVANNIITNWDGNVGTIGTAGSDSCDYDSSITLPSSVTRPGFVLNGWTVTNSATLPSGYTRLDYLESSGTQYIDTGVTYDETKTITVHVTAQTSYIPSSDMIALGFVNNGGVWFGVNTSGNWTIGGSVNSNVSASNKTSDIEIMWTGGREYLKIGGISIGNRGSYSNSNTLKLFGRMASGSFTGRIYYAKIFVDGVLVKELIPAKNSSDVLGMYDTVNNEFKTNSGTGTFIAGPAAQ